MTYYTTRTFNKNFDEVRQEVEQGLKNIGFGIVSEIDMDQKFKEKLGKDFRRYKILGACNPKHAYNAINNEEYIGLMLPCNVIMQEHEPGVTEVSVIDPVASMQAINNPDLGVMAGQIRDDLKSFIEAI